MKKKKYKRETFGGYRSDSEFFKMDFNQFKKYCSGRLAISLFEGRFDAELFYVLNMAHARGIKEEFDNK